jgi:hypothetical protein
VLTREDELRVGELEALAFTQHGGRARTSSRVAGAASAQQRLRLAAVVLEVRMFGKLGRRDPLSIVPGVRSGGRKRCLPCLLWSSSRWERPFPRTGGALVRSTDASRTSRP